MYNIMKIIFFLLTINYITTTKAAVAKIDDIVQACKNVNCDDVKLFCVGFNANSATEDDPCNREPGPKECKIAFATFTKIEADKFRVQLVGQIKPSGWVGIEFPEGTESQNQAGLPGVACLPGSKKLIGLRSKDFVDNDQTSHVGNETIGGPDSKHKEWIVCEFDLKLTPRDFKYKFLINPDNGLASEDKLVAETKTACPMYSTDDLITLPVVTPSTNLATFTSYSFGLMMFGSLMAIDATWF